MSDTTTEQAGRERPPLEDLSHLNPPSTRRAQAAAQSGWKKLTPAQKAERVRVLARNGGGNKGRSKLKH